ncbi:MAG TPA: pyridoxal phosphate-dependent aminotransferase [Candidatus Acidoferrales bacterium]|nr:pyridoxal phosphate-dependent aminotransferase [Candidatus Acidoferrales bacterium]
MISTSKKVDRIEESQTIAMTSLARKLRSEGKNVISLSAGEPDFPTPENVKLAAIKAIQNNFTKYTQNEGTPELREAVAEKFRSENGLDVTAANILVSNGGKHSIYNALQSICNPGDEVIVPAPYWVSFPEMVKLVDAEPVILQTKQERGFTFTAEDIRPLVTKKTKAIIINSPSNPTGSILNEDVLRGIAALADQYGFFIISDEIYEKIVFDNHKHFSIGSIPEIRDKVITASGVSKAYSMTGWRIGFMAANEEIIKRAAKIQSQMTSNPSSISQAAALEALRGTKDDIEKMRLSFQKRRDLMLEKLSKIEELTTTKPAGAFYFFPSIRNLFGKKHNGNVLKNSMDAAHYFLAEAQVALVPGGAFGSDDHIRISYAYSDRELIEAMDRIASSLAKLK